MNINRHTTALLESVRGESLWDMADRMNAAQLRPVRPLERPQPITSHIRLPADNRWPPCASCGLGVSKCECGL